ncbi:MAG: ParB/RepB/Spo0J family partition protein [Desulfobulbaceae bacterium]|nr:ParB/RepB/Spo0J family partition protein [Desulfobulbaceae bacterium]
MTANRGLGKGVGLLFGEEEKEKFFQCNIDNVVPNKYQPRTHFNEEDLHELADSIREKGVIQPLIVTEGETDNYNLVAGERRLRASKIAGLTEVPVVVFELENEDSLLELALIENIQRTDLNPIEEAEAYRKLIDKFGYTQEETANRVGKKRSTITNLLRLLKLPPQIQTDVTNGLLSEGHGRALIKLIDDPVKLQEIRDAIIKNGFSVRQAEKTIKKAVAAKPLIKRTKELNSDEIPSSYTKAITTQLTNRLNSKVVINQNGSRGKIEIEYYSLDDLDRVSSMILDE